MPNLPHRYLKNPQRNRLTPQIAQAVERMLQVDTLSIQNEQEVFTAMIVFKTGQGSFADALIGALGIWADCASTLTFDRKVARSKALRLSE
jgi:predicted nucleic-acid-binding protein